MSDELKNQGYPSDETKPTDQNHNQQDQQNVNEESPETYHSPYDSYRFKTPEGMGQTEHQDGPSSYGPASSDSRTDFYHTQNSGFEPGGKQPRKPKQPKRPGGTGKKVGIAVLVACAFGAAAAVVFFSLSALFGSASTKSPDSKAQSEVQIGNDESKAQGSDSQKDNKDSLKATDPEEVEDQAKAESDSTGDLTIPEVTKKVVPSMVAITNTSVQQYQDFFGETYDQKSVSAGSGIIVGETDDALLIATNDHVISDSHDITVTFVDDSAIAGTIRGTDADNDLAIVSVKKSDIPEKTQKAISIVTVGDSDSVRVGQSVVAIGNALGYGQSVSAGIVSALNRDVKDADGSSRKVIQTDASINPGNSGGALLNMKGELIGINEAKLVDESVEGVGYAIPMSIAEPILTKLGSRASRERVSSDHASYLGISCVTMPSQYTQQGYPEGVYVASVVSGGPADKAGLKQGDIITSFDGTSVTTKEALLNLLEYYSSGEKVSLSVSRVNRGESDFDKKKITIELGAKSNSGLNIENPSEGEKNGNGSGSGLFGNNDNNGLFSFFNN